jgi:hypothetical protein
MLGAGGPNNLPAVDIAEWAFPDTLSDVLSSHPVAVDLRRTWRMSRNARLAAGSPSVQLVAGIVITTTDDLMDRVAKVERRPSAIETRHPSGYLGGAGVLFGDGESGTSSRGEQAWACTTGAQ